MYLEQMIKMRPNDVKGLDLAKAADDAVTAHHKAGLARLAAQEKEMQAGVDMQKAQQTLVDYITEQTKR